MILSQEYQANWSSVTKIAFRFIFSYFILYFLLMFISGSFESTIVWVGQEVLGVDYEFQSNGRGSGDTTFAYVTLFLTAVFTIFSTVMWTILDKKRPSYNKLFYWFLAMIRVFLALTMLLYGFAKVFKVQFPDPSLLRLLQPLGEFSPMGLAWTYMGYSKGFSFFAGIMEVIGGLLLIPRRTQILGALTVIGVMLQVAVMNFMFDIPVKLFSVHIVLFAVILFITDIKRFIHVFILNKETKTHNYYHPIDDETYHKIIIWLKIGLTSLVIGGLSFQMYQAQLMRGDKEEKPPLYGIWEARMFIKNNDTVPALMNEKNRWRYLVVESKSSARVKHMNDQIDGFTFKVDTVAQKISMFDGEGDIQNNFSFNVNDSILILDGYLYNDSLKINFTKKDHTKFLLKSRGFNWINEYPLNR